MAVFVTTCSKMLSNEFLGHFHRVENIIWWPGWPNRRGDSLRDGRSGVRALVVRTVPETRSMVTPRDKRPGPGGYLLPHLALSRRKSRATHLHILLPVCAFVVF